MRLDRLGVCLLVELAWCRPGYRHAYDPQQIDSLMYEYKRHGGIIGTTTGSGDVVQTTPVPTAAALTASPLKESSPRWQNSSFVATPQSQSYETSSSSVLVTSATASSISSSISSQLSAQSSLIPPSIESPSISASATSLLPLALTALPKTEQPKDAPIPSTITVSSATAPLTTQVLPTPSSSPSVLTTSPTMEAVAMTPSLVTPSLVTPLLISPTLVTPSSINPTLVTSSLISPTALMTSVVAPQPRVPPPAASPGPGYELPNLGAIVHQFDKGIGILAVETRPSGDLMLALEDRPEIHTLSPPYGPNTAARLVHRFETGSRILCMTSFDADQFAIILQPAGAADDTAQLWTLNGRAGGPAQLVGDVYEGANFVSLTPLNNRILLASNAQGAIHRIEISNGTEYALFTDPTMVNGISGISYVEPELYFVAPVDGLFARFQLDPDTGDAVSPVDIIADQGLVGVADFTLVPWADHEAYLVNYEQNSILKIDEHAKVTTLVTGWRAPTGITVGKTERDRGTIYFGTEGNLGLKGMIVALNVRKDIENDDRKSRF